MLCAQASNSLHGERALRLLLRCMGALLLQIMDLRTQLANTALKVGAP